jgi:hypothetical protein
VSSGCTSATISSPLPSASMTISYTINDTSTVNNIDPYVSSDTTCGFTYTLALNNGSVYDSSLITF